MRIEATAIHVPGVGVVVLLRQGRRQVSVSRCGVLDRHRNHGFTEWTWLSRAVLRGDRPAFYVRSAIRRRALAEYRALFVDARAVDDAHRLTA